MGLFSSKYERELDRILAEIHMNMSNNYKDAAQEGLKELEQTLSAFKSEGKLKDSKAAPYEAQLSSLQGQLKGYSHKDQKPYWTSH